ncbi:hypothetical protein GCM10011504_38300 [Siccirubricoccus deserti]|uniref:Uncharacterized protein n=1 Tax=Siccirubricoccus deserti TaxID=2013562 RepID=A0A9X0UE18_9PROT|nr:hypothetical protein [Siccirubricoccus deserti]MBC4017082.1 hypothetical protein [Siccirubricoccus deserti]GGC56298.1 hypothetical protein GCM10011504_38300 [Siccirubricoccus deserti]
MASGQVLAGMMSWRDGGSSASRPDAVGGVFRLQLGGKAWRPMARAMPEECQLPCITVDPMTAAGSMPAPGKTPISPPSMESNGSASDLPAAADPVAEVSMAEGVEEMPG